MKSLIATACWLSCLCCVLAQAESSAAAPPNAPSPGDPIKIMVGRLDLEKYKATIKGLTQFGDRRQGTDRNRAAIDWIEARLKSDGCANTCASQIHLFSRRSDLAERTADRAQPGCGGGRRTLSRHAGTHRRQYRSAEATG